MCPFQSTRGILATPQLKNVSIYSITSDELRECRDKETVKASLKGMRIFDEDDDRLNRSAGKISLSKIESKAEVKSENKLEAKLEDEMDEEIGLKQEDSMDIEPQQEFR